MPLSYLNGYLVLESRPLRKLVRGGPVVVVHNGRMLRENMARLRMSEDDLMTRLQGKGNLNPMISRLPFWRRTAGS